MAGEGILHALWIFLPAYVANMAPVFAARILPRWNAPMDGGRHAKDGERLLGPGKTWRGLAGGAVLGALTAVVVAGIAGAWPFMAGWDYGLAGHAGGAPGPLPDCPDTEKCAHPTSSLAGVALFGGLVGGFALVGDAVKSYFKRRLKIARGRPWFPFDQLDFVMSGLAAFYLAGPLLADGWASDALLADPWVLATLLILTPLLHLLVNRIGFWLRLKEVPW